METINEREEEKEFEEEEEKGEKSQHFGVKITKILIYYLIIGFIGWNFFNFMFNSKYCNIEEVVIKGNDYLNKDEIFSKSQIKLGENIFKLDLKKPIDSLTQEPWIKELEIKRIIPNKIIISLKEREAAAIVYISEEYFILSKEGMVLSKIDKPEGLSIPLISGLKVSEVKIGETIKEPEFRIALEIINSANIILPREFYKVKIFALDDFLLFNIDDTLKVRVNKPEEIINKGDLLREALRKIDKEKLAVEYIDMRFKDSAIIKVKN